VVAACARHLTFADIAGRLGVSEADVRRALADGLQDVRADGKVDTDLMSALPRSRAVKLWATDPGGTTVLLAPLA
jgi:hypothetical protein